MHLIEVLVAGTVFTIASGSSLQFWNATAMRAQQLNSREHLEQQIEHDRLQLHTLWRSSAPGNTPTAEGGCTTTAPQLLALANSRPPLPALRREIQVSPDGQALQIHWQAVGDPVVQRQRLVTPAGLGLCSLPTAAIEPVQEAQQTQQAEPPPSPPQPTGVAPLTDSQVEGVPG